MLQALSAAGFVGIVQGEDGRVYARTSPDMPEFSMQPEGGRWRFAILWPLRASDAQRAEWALGHPSAALDVDLGETRMQFFGGAQDLDAWAALVADMVKTCMAWRRISRQGDEGM